MVTTAFIKQTVIYFNICLILLIPFGLTYGYYSKPPLYDTISGKYYNTVDKDFIEDAPWIVNIDSSIPFLFLIKDTDENDLGALYCIAIYDISDGERRYYINGVWYFTPQPNNNWYGHLQDSALTPDPTVPTNVFNQVFYRYYHQRINQNWWYVIIDSFNHAG